MSVIVLSLAVYLFLSAPVVRADEKVCDELIQGAEHMWLQCDYDESDRLLDEATSVCPNRAEIYWRKARNAYVRIEAIPRGERPDKAVLTEHYQNMVNLADKCIGLDDSNGSCWLWKGVALGRLSTTQGVLQSAWIGSELEHTLLKAISLRPSYRSGNGRANSLADSYYALGVFYRMVPEWACYFPFKQIFGTCGNKEKAIACQRRALALEPACIRYTMELAVSLMCHGQAYGKHEEIEEAKKILKDLEKMPEISPVDKIDKKDAMMLLADPSLACGYHRDAQQDVSKEAYERDM